MRYRYALPGHKTGQRPNGNIYSGFGASNIVLRGTERKREYPEKTTAGNSRSKGKGRALRQTGKGFARRFRVAD